MAHQDPDDVAEQLYALTPEEFTAARDAAAKGTHDKDARAALKALRRPTVSAWLVNLLARAQPDLLQQLLELGPELAEAQSTGQADALRILGKQRRELVAAVTGAAVDRAGRSVTPQVRTEVEQTLEAALADPVAADAVRSGRLVRPLSYAGFGGVDLEGAVARPATRSARSAPSARKSTKQRDDGALEQQALDAAADLDDAVRACQTAVRRRDEAGRQQSEAVDAARAAADDVRRLEQELTEARTRASSAQAAETAAAEASAAAEADAETAEKAVAAAQDAAEQARAALDRVRRG